MIAPRTGSNNYPYRFFRFIRIAYSDYQEVERQKRKGADAAKLKALEDKLSALTLERDQVPYSSVLPPKYPASTFSTPPAS